MIDDAPAELREMSKQNYISPYRFAVVYAGLGEKEQAFTWLDKAFQDRSFFLIWLKVELQFYPLRETIRASGFTAAHRFAAVRFKYELWINSAQRQNIAH